MSGKITFGGVAMFVGMTAASLFLLSLADGLAGGAIRRYGFR